SLAAAGLPTNSVLVANSGQYWTINGNLTYAAGTPTAAFNFGTLPPSSTVAPVQVSGSLVYTVAPAVELDGNSIPNGTYPLIQYGGSVIGALPATLILTNSANPLAAGYLSNSVSAKILYAVITNSPVTAGLVWRVGNGAWDYTTQNWSLFGSPALYTDSRSATFNDTASGASPITVTLNSTVTPTNGITFNNTTKAYALAGAGAITGAAFIDIKGTAPVTLAGTNTYTGGTVLEKGAGPLNLGFGGDTSGANSAIGTGPLTLNQGSVIDNSSGGLLTLAANNPQYWNDDFTFLGSSSLDLGQGLITLGSGLVTLTVSNSTLSVSNLITDNNNNFGLAKNGPGTLTLAGYNTFLGGVTLNAGQLNLNNGGDGGADSAVGAGTFTINGGTIDNTSGADETIYYPLAQAWNGNFTFNGSANLDLGTGDINLNIGNVIVNVVSNTLSSEGAIGGHNKAIIKQGLGTLVLGGNLNDNNGLGLTVNQGVVQLAKVSNGANHATGAGNPTTVNTNGVIIITGSGGDQVNDSSPVVINGGVFDLNGQSETFHSITNLNGTLRSSGAAVATIRPWGAGPGLVGLAGNYANFDITNGGNLVNNFNVVGSGNLIKLGGGTLTLAATNTYTGSTVVSNGTVALTGGSSLPLSGAILLASNTAALDLTLSTITNTSGVPTLTLSSGQT
ncbi:MAG TPA: autotransporter-associated beta strand repeat-containing protein, partial [Verrucomicrobiae bacterium]